MCVNTRLVYVVCRVFLGYSQPANTNPSKVKNQDNLKQQACRGRKGFLIGGTQFLICITEWAWHAQTENWGGAHAPSLSGFYVVW